MAATEIITLIVGAITTFLFGEKLYTWIFVKQDKRAKEADNEAKAVETLQKALELIASQLDKSNTDSAEKQELIISLQKDLYKEREEKAKMTTEVEVLKCKECRVHGCDRRDPPNGY